MTVLICRLSQCLAGYLLTSETDRACAVAAPPDEQIRIDQPSATDWCHWIESLVREKGHLKARLARRESAAIFNTPSLEAEVGHALDAETSRLATALVMQRVFGSVLCTSGHAKYSHEDQNGQPVCSHLDWGLIKVACLRLPNDLTTVTTVSNCVPPQCQPRLPRPRSY